MKKIITASREIIKKCIFHMFPHHCSKISEFINAAVYCGYKVTVKHKYVPLFNDYDNSLFQLSTTTYDYIELRGKKQNCFDILFTQSLGCSLTPSQILMNEEKIINALKAFNLV
jgi:hypothetical protein